MPTWSHFQLRMGWTVKTKQTQKLSNVTDGLMATHHPLLYLGQYEHKPLMPNIRKAVFATGELGHLTCLYSQSPTTRYWWKSDSKLKIMKVKILTEILKVFVLDSSTCLSVLLFEDLWQLFSPPQCILWLSRCFNMWSWWWCGSVVVWWLFPHVWGFGRMFDNSLPTYASFSF